MTFDTERLLITGAAGWLGQGFLSALHGHRSDAGCEAAGSPAPRIRVLVQSEMDASVVRKISDDVEIVIGDLRRPEHTSQFCDGAKGALLFHLAGVIHPRRVREFYDVNVAGTINLLSAASEARVRRAVVMSSNSPLGCGAEPRHVFDERAPYNPYMHYGRSKMQMEQYAREVQARGRLETVLIRAPWFYGPFQPARQTLFFHMVRDGRAPIVGGGENRRSMVYIDNLTAGLMLAATTRRAAGETYWIADERPYSMNEIVDTIERLLETEFGQACAHRRLRLPGIVSEIAGIGDRLIQGAGFYSQKLHVLSEMNKTIACSVDKAKRELGYAPTVALEEGMRRSLRWILAQVP
jgi:nucleoside-diphosphate-sugar epimerase